jgi:hypothetical protein
MDAALFGISMVGKDLLSNLSRTNHRCAEKVMKSRLALTEMQSECHWVLPNVTSTKRHAKRVREEGGRVVLTWLPSGSNCEEVDGCAISATRIEPCHYRHSSIEDQQGPKCTLLAVRRQQADGHPSHAGMLEVAKRARNNAPETEG